MVDAKNLPFDLKNLPANPYDTVLVRVLEGDIFRDRVFVRTVEHGATYWVEKNYSEYAEEVVRSATE